MTNRPSRGAMSIAMTFICIVQILACEDLEKSGGLHNMPQYSLPRQEVSPRKGALWVNDGFFDIISKTNANSFITLSIITQSSKMQASAGCFVKSVARHLKCPQLRVLILTAGIQG